MGKFEVKTDITKDYAPDKVTFIMSLGFSDSCSKSNLKGKMLQTLDDLKQELKNRGVENYSLKYLNLTVQESAKAPSLFTKNAKVVSIGSVSIEVSVKFDSGLVKEQLEEIVSALNSVDANILNSSYYVEISNYTELKKSMRIEMAQNCRKEAEELVGALGSVIAGIDSICYNSSGSLLRSPSIASVTPVVSSNSFGGFNDFGSTGSLEFDEDSEEEVEDTDPTVLLSNSYAEGVVETIMDSKITVRDCITVVFLVK